jgi:WD40 repeat protein
MRIVMCLDRQSDRRIAALRRGAALAIAALTAALVLGGQHAAKADTYVQSGDEPQSEILSRSRDGTRAVKRSDTNGYDVEVWDLNANKRLSSIRGLSGVVNVANLSPDGHKVVTAERRGVVGVWDAGTGKQLMLLKGHGDQIHDARFSPDGSLIASASRDGTARTWDAATGAKLAAHKQRGGFYVDAVSFSPDGRWVLSAGNGWAEVWNARSGEEFMAVQIGPTDGGAFSTEARLSKDGRSIVVSEGDGSGTKSIPIALPAN